jgi:hypothetical protein
LIIFYSYSYLHLLGIFNTKIIINVKIHSVHQTPSSNIQGKAIFFDIRRPLLHSRRLEKRPISRNKKGVLQISQRVSSRQERHTSNVWLIAQ